MNPKDTTAKVAASVAPAVATPMSLCVASSRRGMNIITSTPSIGRKVPTVSSQF